ncbi:MAG: ROK family protein [Chitinivibrionales bacterium]|nr:ROK family protein [Chitinivibrionales bacterium]
MHLLRRQRSVMNTFSIGIDLGGTNLKGIVMERDGTSRHLTRVPTEADKGGKKVLENILALIGLLLEKEISRDSCIGVGLGTPGFVDGDGTVLGGAENLPGWKSTSIYSSVFATYGLKASATNDVTVTALAESQFGAGKGVGNMVCLALGTGIGGGIVINNQVYKGTHGMAGEIGHIIVEPDGIPCTCGHKGCVEQYASATGIVNITRKLAPVYESDAPSTLKRIALESPELITAKIVYDHAKDNDPFGIYINDVVCEKLARALGTVINTLSPDRIILGGGVMKAGRIIIDTVSRHVPDFCWRQLWERCDIVAAELGENAGVLGAASLAFADLGDKSHE